MPKSRSRSFTRFSTRRRWTMEDAKAALAEARESGLTLRGFAKREGLDPQRLSAWQRRIREAGDSVSAAFEEVARTQSRAPTGVEAAVPGFEVVVRGGRVVRVGVSFDGEALRRLLAVVEEDSAC